jgi:hypothetical protein
MNFYIIRVLPDTILNKHVSFDEIVKKSFDDPATCLDLDESWAGIHFTLTDEYPIPREDALQKGIAWDDTSLENVLMGGTATAHQGSYGRARYLTPQDVAFFAKKLDAISLEQFEQWYDAEWLLENHIPPEIWDEDDARGWLVSYFARLKDFYQGAASNSEGLLMYML